MYLEKFDPFWCLVDPLLDGSTLVYMYIIEFRYESESELGKYGCDAYYVYRDVEKNKLALELWIQQNHHQRNYLTYAPIRHRKNPILQGTHKNHSRYT